MKQISLGLILVVLLAACSQQANPGNEELSAQAGTWQKMGGALDFTVEKNALYPRLLIDRSGNLVAAWTENNNGWRVYLEQWTSTGWQSFGAGSPPSPNPGFSIVFDSTNSPVVSYVISSERVSVFRRDATSKTWKQLGATFDGFGVFADKSGNLYSILNSRPGGINIESQTVRRWNGTNWQTVYTPFKRGIYQNAYGFDFDRNGKPRVFWIADESLETHFSIWDGTSWVDVGKLKNGILDNNDQPITALLSGNVVVTGTAQIQRNGQPLGAPLNVTDYPRLFVDNLNRPLVTHGVKGSSTADDNLVLKRWTGSAWVQLGGVIDRISTRSTSFGSVLVDSKSTIYAIWQECVVTLSDPFVDCPNNNIYVSKYVP